MGQGKTAYRLKHYIGLLERNLRNVFQVKPVRQTVQKELLDLGKQLPGVWFVFSGYGEGKVLSAINRITAVITPTLDIIRSYLEEPQKDSVIHSRD